MATPTLTSNDPSIGFISWTGFNIAYKGAGYPVAAGSTDMAYVWWQYNGGAPTLQMTETLPDTMTEDDLLLFLNRGGIVVNAQASTFIDGSLLIDGTVAAKALKTDELVVGGNLSQFEAGYDPSTKETPEGAQAKADSAQTAAEQAAALDAQAKADAAEAAATAAAATDAQRKADAAAADAEQAAKTYADLQASGAKEDAIAAAALDAQQKADAAEAAAKTAAAADATAKADAAEAAAVSAAAIDAQAKADAAEASATAAAAADAKAKADAAQAAAEEAANNYAELQASGAKEDAIAAAKIDAQAKADAAKAAAISAAAADAQAKADAAEAAATAAAAIDAQNKADAAEAAAAITAQAKADAARDAAVSAASADAKTKADAAKAAAISAAAADATAKADAAESAATAAAASDAQAKADAAAADAEAAAKAYAALQASGAKDDAIAAAAADAKAKADAAEAAAKAAAAADATAKADAAETAAKVAAAADAQAKADAAKAAAISAAATDAENKANVARTGALNDVRTMWGYPSDTTFIDGGNIYTRTVRAEHLESNLVLTSRLIAQDQYGQETFSVDGDTGIVNVTGDLLTARVGQPRLELTDYEGGSESGKTGAAQIRFVPGEDVVTDWNTAEPGFITLWSNTNSATDGFSMEMVTPDPVNQAKDRGRIRIASADSSHDNPRAWVYGELHIYDNFIDQNQLFYVTPSNSYMDTDDLFINLRNGSQLHADAGEFLWQSGAGNDWLWAQPQQLYYVGNGGKYLSVEGTIGMQSTLQYMGGSHRAVVAGDAGAVFVGYRNDSGGNNHGLMVQEGTSSVRILSRLADPGVEIINAGGDKYRNVYASDFKVASDRATKENLRAPVTSALDTLRAAPVYEYDYKEEVQDAEGSRMNRIGPIADDLPENIASKTKGGGDLYEGQVQMLNLMQLVGLLTHAVQELDEEIDDLREMKANRANARFAKPFRKARDFSEKPLPAKNIPNFAQENVNAHRPEHPGSRRPDVAAR